LSVYFSPKSHTFTHNKKKALAENVRQASKQLFISSFPYPRQLIRANPAVISQLRPLKGGFSGNSAP
jgi:hypothetical protein